MAFSYSKFGLAFNVVHFIQIIQVETIVFVSKIWIREETNSYIIRFIYNLHQK